MDDERKVLGAARLCACMNLRKAARAVTCLYDDILRPTRLRANQFALLTITRVRGSITVTRLADEAVMDRTTLTRNLKPLEKRKLVRIREGRDRRMREVTLTAQGRDAWAKAVPLWQKAQRQIVEGIGRERLRQLVSNLDAMVAVARGE